MAVDVDELVMEPAPEFKAKGKAKGKKKTEASRGRALGGARAGNPSSGGSGEREAREKMLKAAEERMKGVRFFFPLQMFLSFKGADFSAFFICQSTGRGVQARNGAGKLSKALADEQKKASNRVQVELEKKLTVNLYD